MDTENADKVYKVFNQVFTSGKPLKAFKWEPIKKNGENGKLIKGNPAGVEIWGAELTVPMEEYSVFKARRLPSGEEIAPKDWALAHTIKNGTTIG